MYRVLLIDDDGLVGNDMMNVEETWRLWSPIVTGDYLRRLLQGHTDPWTEAKEYFNVHGLFAEASGFAAVAMQLLNFKLIMKNETDAQVSAYVRTIYDLCQRAMGDPSQRTVVYMQEGRFALVFSFHERSENSNLNDLHRYMERIEKSLDQYMDVKCVLASGPVCKRLTDIGHSYTAAENQVDRQLVGCIHDIMEALTLTIHEEKELILAVDRCDIQAVRLIISELFQSLRARRVHPNSAQSIILELIRLEDKAWRKSGLNGSIRGFQSLSTETLGKLQYLDEFEQWIQKRYDRLLEALCETRFNGSFSRHVQKVMRFMWEHYQDSISLEQAAEHAGITPPYLSRLFREETQSTFTGYLNQIRIESSKRLIEEGDRNIKQICHRVGFANYNYFFKVFKDVVGVTPQTYVKSRYS